MMSGMTLKASAAAVRGRPSRWWYVVAVLVPLATLLAPVLLRGGDVGDPLPAGKATAVAFTAGEKRMVWAREDDAAEVDCAFGRGGRLASASAERMIFHSVDKRAGGARWHGALLLTAAPSGVYEVTCTGSAVLSIGAPPRFIGTGAQILIWVARMAAVAAGLALAVGVLVRRRPEPAGTRTPPVVPGPGHSA